MNKKIIEYLHANKEKFSKDILIRQLEQAGYADNEITEAAGLVYENAAPDKKSLADIFAKKNYRRTSEKVVDFLIGLFFPWVFGLGLSVIDNLERFFWLIIFSYIVFLFLSYRRRRYIFKGLFTNLTIIGAVVVAAASYFIIFKPRFFWF